MANRKRLFQIFHRWFAVVAFVTVLVVVGALGYRVYTSVFENDAGEEQAVLGETRTVEVLEGFSAEDVARLLEREGVIDSEWSFRTRVRVTGAGADLKPGTYEFRVGEDHDSIIAKLREGAAPGTDDLERVTVPEGLAIEQTAARLSDIDFIDADEYAALAQDADGFDVPAVGGTTPEISSLEGLLFPSTYMLSQEADARTLIDEQLEAFSAQSADLPWDRAEDLGVTPYDVVIIASLIEKEAKIAEERPLVAAVIYNRLQRDMALGIDASVRYAVKKWTEPLTRSDLQADSPFNTRERTGLPPAPIASPGRKALEAALQPAEVDYLYYVLEDEEGRHFFTSSYDEFLEAKARQPGR